MAGGGFYKGTNRSIRQTHSWDEVDQELVGIVGGFRPHGIMAGGEFHEAAAEGNRHSTRADEHLPQGAVLVVLLLEDAVC